MLGSVKCRRGLYRTCLFFAAGDYILVGVSTLLVGLVPLKKLAELVPDVRLTMAKYHALAVVPASHLVCID